MRQMYRTVWGTLQRTFWEAKAICCKKIRRQTCHFTLRTLLWLKTPKLTLFIGKERCKNWFCRFILETIWKRVASNIQSIRKSSGHQLAFFLDQQQQKKSRGCYASWTQAEDIPDKCATTTFVDRLTRPNFIWQWKKLRTTKHKNVISQVAKSGD